MVQVLKRIPSLGERFAKAFAEGGIALGEAGDKFAKTQAKQLAGRQKLADNVRRERQAWEKDENKMLRPDERNAFDDIYTDLVLTQPHLSKNDALKLSYEGVMKQQAAAKHDAEIGQSKRMFNFGATKPFQHDIPDKFKRAGSAIQERPSILATEAPTALAKSFETLTGGLGLPQEQVNKYLQEKGLEAPDFIKPRKKLSETSSEYFRKHLPEDEKKGAEDISDLESIGIDLLPWSWGTKIARAGGKGFKSIVEAVRGESKLASTASKAEALMGAKIAPAEKAAAEFSPAKEAIKEASLEGRVTAPPKTATETRMERLEPGKKLSPTQQLVETRTAQLKAYPKLAQEIIKDGIDREARRAAKVPKTENGWKGLETRREIANQKLPVVQEAYRKAASRVRAFEEEMLKHSGSELERHKQLYEVAKDELKQASIDLEHAIGNAKHGTAKATHAESLTAARNKIDDITEHFSQGKEYKLSGHDYSPKMIADAKHISKKKPLPNLRQDDFYNQIHDRYIGPYRQRLAELQEEMKSAKGVGDWNGYDLLKKEANVYEKMIESAEAEKVIHTHKSALRDIDEAKKARDRFAELKPGKSQPKVEKVASESIWKKKLEEAKTPHERAKVIDEGVNEAAQAHPEHAKKIHAEGDSMKAEFAKGPMHGPEKGPTLKMAINRVHGFATRHPNIAKYATQFFYGMVGAFVDDVLREMGAGYETRGIVGTTLKGSAALLGDKIFTPKSFAAKTGWQGAGHLATRYFLNKWHLSRAKKQYLSNDAKERSKFMEQSKSRQKQVLKDLRTG